MRRVCSFAMAVAMVALLSGCLQNQQPQPEQPEANVEVFGPPEWNFVCNGATLDDGLPHNAVVVESDETITAIRVEFDYGQGGTLQVEAIHADTGWAEFFPSSSGWITVVVTHNTGEVISVGPIEFSTQSCTGPDPDPEPEPEPGEEEGEGDPEQFPFVLLTPPLSSDGVAEMTRCSDESGNAPRHPEDPERSQNSAGIELRADLPVSELKITIRPDGGVVATLPVDISGGVLEFPPHGESGSLVVHGTLTSGEPFRSYPVHYRVIEECEEPEEPGEGEGEGEGEPDPEPGEGEGEGEEDEGEEDINPVVPGDDFPWALLGPTPNAEGVRVYSACTDSNGNASEENVIGIDLESADIDPETILAITFRTNYGDEGWSEAQPIDPAGRGWTPSGAGMVEVKVELLGGESFSTVLAVDRSAC